MFLRYPSGLKTNLFEQFKATQFTLLLFDGYLMKILNP
jgi:hypothetical protein